MTRERLTAAVAAAAQQPDGGTWVLQALAEVPGCSWREAEKSFFGRTKSPAGLLVGEWWFEPTALPGRLSGVRVVHAVGGIRLAETVGTLEQCAERLVDAVAARVEALGAVAQAEFVAVSEGLARAAEQVRG